MSKKATRRKALPAKGAPRKPRSPFSTYNNLRLAQRSSATNAVYTEFARRLQGRMQDLGWNQSELARRCNELLPAPHKGQIQNLEFGRDRISRYVRGLTIPRPESLPIVARALGCEEKDLLPPMAFPSAGDPTTRPPFEIIAVDNQRVSISVNRTVTMATAMKIAELLQSEDKMP